MGTHRGAAEAAAPLTVFTGATAKWTAPGPPLPEEGVCGAWVRISDGTGGNPVVECRALTYVSNPAFNDRLEQTYEVIVRLFEGHIPRIVPLEGLEGGQAMRGCGDGSGPVDGLLLRRSLHASIIYR